MSLYVVRLTSGWICDQCTLRWGFKPINMGLRSGDHKSTGYGTFPKQRIPSTVTVWVPQIFTLTKNGDFTLTILGLTIGFDRIYGIS